MSHTSIEASLHELAAPAFWSDERLRAMCARIPPYRLSKFQDALPDAAQTEMLAAFFIDAAGAGAVSQASGAAGKQGGSNVESISPPLPR